MKAEALVRLVCQGFAREDVVLHKGRRAGFTEDEIREAARRLGYVVQDGWWILTRPLPRTDQGTTAKELVERFPFLHEETAEGLLELMRLGAV